MLQRAHERRQRNLARAALGLPIEARDNPEGDEEAKADTLVAEGTNRENVVKDDE